MNLQDELKALKERIAELEEQAKEEQKFPQKDDEYWYIDDEGDVFGTFYDNHYIDRYHQEIGNVFKTKEQADFAVEKLKVESELRKFSRPFDEDDNNYFIELSMFDKTLTVDDDECWQIQGVIYFESTEKALQAIDTVGQERIKKYIFGLEEK